MSKILMGLALIVFMVSCVPLVPEAATPTPGPTTTLPTLTSTATPPVPEELPKSCQPAPFEPVTRRELARWEWRELGDETRFSLPNQVWIVIQTSDLVFWTFIVYPDRLISFNRFEVQEGSTVRGYISEPRYHTKYGPIYFHGCGGKIYYIDRSDQPQPTPSSPLPDGEKA